MLEAKLRSSNRRNYYKLKLWPTQDDYEIAAKVEGADSRAVCLTETTVDDEGNVVLRPKLGEIHFVSGTWDVNTVAHECTHAVLHRLRYCEPGPRAVLDEFAEDYDQEDEEVIAYEAGDWVEAVLCWLTNNDPASPYPKNVFNV